MMFVIAIHMNSRELSRIISDQMEELDEILVRDDIIDRHIPVDKLEGFLAHPTIVAILGVRRAGKSILSSLLLREKTSAHLNFDDERLAGFEAKDLNMVLETFYQMYGTDLEYIFLDEIQNVPGWELFANRLRRTKKVILTGSNAHLLSGELATHLTGRHLDFTLFPFSFSEYLSMKGNQWTVEDILSTKHVSQVKKELEEYIALGGFPEVFKFGKSILLRIYEDIIQRDILLRYGIRNRRTFSELAKFIISNSSNEISYSRLKNMFGIKDGHTVKNYIDHLSSSYLVFTLERFSFKLKNHSIAPRKIYCIDTGLINTVAFSFSENRGSLMENIVAVELKRRISYWHSGAELYYWKDNGDMEVDFVWKEGPNIKQLIQVTYSSGPDEIQEREIKSLIRASNDLRCEDLLLITWDHEDELLIDDKRIVCLPLWKWLLNRSDL